MRRAIRSLRLAALVSMLAVVGSPALSSEKASVSGPSVARAGNTVTLNARALPGGAAVTLAVTTPGGREAHYSAVAGADGTLAVPVKAGAAGIYEVRVLDSGGRTLASTSFNAQ